MLCSNTRKHALVFNKQRIWRLLGPDLAAVNLEKQFDRLSVSFRRNE